MFDGVIRFFHLLAAAVWVGGLITLGALVPALRRAGADRPILQAVARQFGRVSWAAMAVAVATGITQLWRLDVSLSSPFAGRLAVKLGFVGLAIGLAAVHQATARRSSPAMRGAIQGAVLVVSLAIIGAAVAL